MRYRVLVLGNGEWGTGNGERGIGNRIWVYLHLLRIAIFQTKSYEHLSELQVSVAHICAALESQKIRENSAESSPMLTHDRIFRKCRGSVISIVSIAIYVA